MRPARPTGAPPIVRPIASHGSSGDAVELEPRRHERHVVGARRATPRSTRHRRQSRRVAPPTLVAPRRWRPAIAARSPSRTSGSTSSVAPTCRGRASRARARARPGASRGPPAGPSGSPSARPVSAMAPLAAHASTSARGSSGGQAVGQGAHGATMIARRPAVRLRHGSALRHPRRPGRRRPLRRRAAVGRPGHPRWCVVELDVPVVDAPPLPSWWPAVVVGVPRAGASRGDHPTCDVVVARRATTLAAIEATVDGQPARRRARSTTLLRGRRPPGRSPRGCCSSRRCTRRSRPGRSSPPGEPRARRASASTAGDAGAGRARRRRAPHHADPRRGAQRARHRDARPARRGAPAGAASTTRSPRCTCAARGRRSARAETSTSSAPGPTPRPRTSCASSRARARHRRRRRPGHRPRPRRLPRLRGGAAGVRGTSRGGARRDLRPPRGVARADPGGRRHREPAAPHRPAPHRVAGPHRPGRRRAAPRSAWGLVDEIEA